MPAPPNTTPATATALTEADLPFTELLDVSGAPLGATGYPNCYGVQYAAVWYSYTAGDCDTAIAFLASLPTAGAYVPITSVWTGTIPDLSLATISVGGESEPWCAYQPPDLWFQVPVLAGQTIYFQIVNFLNAAPDVALQVQVVTGPNAAIPAGPLFVPSDESGFPAALLDPAIGTLLRLVPCPACEQAAILQDGTICIASESGGTGITPYYVDAYVLLNPELTGLATVTTAVLNGGSGGSPPSPPGPPPPTPPPPGGGCTAFVAPAGMDAAVASALSGAGATICASFAVLAAAEPALNAAGYAIQRTSPPSCTMRYRLHKCVGQLTGSHCGHPMCSAYTGGGGSAQDIDIEANGLWAWVPR